MNPHDALALQDLLRGNLTRPGYRQYLQNYSESVMRTSGGPLVVGEDGKPNGDAMADNQRSVLENAETFYVSADMADVAVFASRTLDDLDRFSHDLWPTDFGFLVFQKGLITMDVWGNPISFKAMTWHRRSDHGRAGMMVVTYSDTDDERDSMNLQSTPQQRDEMASQMGRLIVSHTFWIADGQRVGPPQVEPPKDYEKFAVQEGQALAPTATNNSRTILALLMLLGQTITVTTRHDLRPSNPKRARKMKVPGQVTVITLRHAKESKQQEGETRTEWTHRWLVRGFWRNQHVGPNYPQAVEVGPGKYRARIWVAPFIKGPEGAPIVQSRKVNSLTR